MIVETRRLWIYGDDIDTDVLAPGRYMKSPIAEMAAHCLSAVDPDFVAGVAPGDAVVAGENFGMGSSREQAVQVLLHHGISAVIAKSFGRIFYRNAINLGLPVLECADTGDIGADDRLRIDAGSGTVANLTTGAEYRCPPIPPQLLEMIADGGLIPHLEKKQPAG